MTLPGRISLPLIFMLTPQDLKNKINRVALITLSVSKKKPSFHLL